MKETDKQLIEHIEKHFEELKEELLSINDSLDIFQSNYIYNKAIKMDLLQIGENVNSLSADTIELLNKNDVKGIIDIRNFIVHGYVVVKDKIIWEAIHNDLPRMIKKLKEVKDNNK